MWDSDILREWLQIISKNKSLYKKLLGISKWIEFKKIPIYWPWQVSSVILDLSVHMKNFPLNNWTPMTLNMKTSNKVTKTMLPMVLTATMTHWTTCLRPLARLMARSGRNTRRTRRIFTTDMAPELKIHMCKNKEIQKCK